MGRGIAFLLFLLAAWPVHAEDPPPAIAFPSDGDEYSRLVAQAAAQDPSTDFRALRFAWLDSKARERHHELSLKPDVDKLLQAAGSKNYSDARDRAVALLSQQYVSLAGQVFLLISCGEMNDKACAGQAEFVSRGLVQSILKSGDGKTCDTGWEVAMIEEEYSLLHIKSVEFKQQALIMGKEGGHSCDAMTVSENGKDVTYFFTIDRILADEMKMLKPR
jgi:hypothetical protein